jgi:hypothetical protein
MNQLVPVVRSLDDLRALGGEHACVLHIVFRDASKGPLLLGQVRTRRSAVVVVARFQQFAVAVVDRRKADGECASFADVRECCRDNNK